MPMRPPRNSTPPRSRWRKSWPATMRATSTSAPGRRAKFPSWANINPTRRRAVVSRSNMLATLLIVFREVIEAGLIVGIVLAATKGVARRGLWVGYGIAAGVFGACLVAAFAGEIASLFAGAGQEFFDAGILLLAVGMLTWHNVWMAGHGRAMAQEMKGVGAAVSKG